MNRRCPIAVALVVLAGCEASEDVRLQKSDRPTGAIDHPPIEIPRMSASPRRLSTDQWRGSFATVFGKDANGAPLEWTLEKNRPALDNPAVTRSLGEPDYIGTTSEALQPSVLYAKFADDAARSLCDSAISADRARVDAASRTVVRRAAFTDTATSNPAAVDDNLRYLKLRFHGIHVTSGDESPVAPLRALFASATAGSAATDDVGRVVDGWRAVCVALATAPEFHLY